MRLSVIALVILIQCGFLFGQDGSDMNYVKSADLNESYIGRKLHIDFGQRSFGVIDKREGRFLDSVLIKVDDKTVKFIEHREDDGFNNWFSRQYLESIEKTNDLKLRIREFELLKINEKDILVKAFFVYVDKNEKVLPEKSFTQGLSFEKKEIIEFLFKVKNK
jgi:hypothetical protein